MGLYAATIDSIRPASTANAVDPVLSAIEMESRRATLIAKREQRGGKTFYQLDIIILRGDNETVFFDL